MQVKAKQVVFYKGARRRPGTVFEIDPKHFSEKGMIRMEDVATNTVEAETPEPVPTTETTLKEIADRNPDLYAPESKPQTRGPGRPKKVS